MSKVLERCLTKFNRPQTKVDTHRIIDGKVKQLIEFNSKLTLPSFAVHDNEVEWRIQDGINDLVNREITPLLAQNIDVMYLSTFVYTEHDSFDFVVGIRFFLLEDDALMYTLSKS